MLSYRKIKKITSSDIRPHVIEVDDPRVTLYTDSMSWTPNDEYFVLASACESSFACPMLSLYVAADGICVARFCSPMQFSFTRVLVFSVVLPPGSSGNLSDSSSTHVVAADCNGNVMHFMLVGI